MNGKQLVTIVLATIFLTYCIQETAAAFKLKKLIKAGLIIKALSPSKIILPLPIPIPILHQQQHSHGGHDFHGGYHGGHFGGHGGHFGGYGGHGGYGHGGYDFSHVSYPVHSTGYYVQHHSHSW